MAGRARGPIVHPFAFWDTSAVVPLCVQEARSARALALHKQYQMVVWWATAVEVASALARLSRMNLLSSQDWARAQNTASVLAQAWTEVTPSNRVRTKAIQIVERYDLRAADGFQLAAALEWCSEVPRGRKFLTADARLLQAALLCGFDALNP